jgi:type II secretory pathway component PulF
VFERLSELLQNEIRLRSTIITALSYPMLIGAVASVVLTALVFFVLPQFAQVFRSMGTPAPPMTRMLLDSAQFLRENILLLGVLLVSGGFGLFQLASTDAARRYRDGKLLNGLLIREATRPLLMGRTFRLMGSMLQSGVPLLEVIQLCRSSVKNVHFHKLFDLLEFDVLNGRGIAGGLNACEFVPPGAAEMVTTAEKTGNLGSIMETVGEFYEEEGQRQVTTIAGYLEPIIIVGLGVVVAFVVLSIMLPLLDFSSAGS